MMNPKYDTIGITYNSTRRADPYLLERIYSLLSPVSTGHYLDIGCGTGNYTIPLSKRGLNFTGVDPSEVMLNEAKSKSRNVRWISGTVESIPFADNRFDGAIATLTVHHWNNMEVGFRELYRVLKSGGRLVIFTSSPEQMETYWLNHYFPDVMTRSTEKMPSVQLVVDSLTRAGMKLVDKEIYTVRDDLVDLFLQSGKNRPEIYFDENVRKGISTFASLATVEEMDSGLKKLRHDLDNDLFQDIKMKYESDVGDYLFLVAEKQ